MRKRDGLLGVVLGVLWTAQGLDLLGGSVMSGVTIWAVIGPFVTAKIGASAARALFLTGGRFPAPQAHRLGLVHEVVPAGELDAVVDVVVRDLLLGAPSAQRRVKALLRAIVNRPAADVTPLTSAALADQRVSADGQEGLAAFLEKRRAQWVVEP